MADATSYEPGAGSGGGGVPTSREIATTSPLTGGGTLLSDLTLGIDTSGLVLTSRTVSAGSGLTGGGDLSANRTLSLDATAVVAPSRTITAGTNLSGGGDLSTNRTISHAASGVTANTYPSPSSVTVDAQGHVTAITAGSGGGGDALTDLGSNPSVTPLAPGKYLITGGGSGALILEVGAVGDYWRIVVADNGVTTAGNIYAAALCYFRLDGADHTEIGYDTGAGYCAFEFWKTSETRYNVLAIKAAGGQT